MAEMPDMISATALPPERHFEIQALFAEERKRLTDWLEKEAAEAMGAPDATIESAYARIPGLLANLDHLYCTKTAIKPQLLTAASNGTLTGYVPQRALIASHNLFRIIAFFAECALAVALMIMGQATAAFVLASVMLALGGLALGNGLGNLYLRNWFKALPAVLAPPQQGRATLEYLQVLGGLIVIGGISYLRTIGEEGSAVLFVVAVPLLLALLIVLFESLYVLTKAKYEFLRRQMAEAQRWFAIENHRTGIETYRIFYQGKVTEFSLRMRRAVSLAGRA